MFTQACESKIGGCVSADIREDPDGSLSCNLNLPAIRTSFLEVVGFNKTLVDKLDDKIHGSNGRPYSQCGSIHAKAIVDVEKVESWLNSGLKLEG